MALSACTKQFILQVLCGNQALKSSFLTFLNGLVLTATARISILSAQIARLNVINQFLNIEIQAVRVLQNRIQADLNLIGGPLVSSAQATQCSQLNRVLNQAKEVVPIQKLAGLQNLIYSLNRKLNVANALDAEQKVLQSFVNDAQAMIDYINQVCP